MISARALGEIDVLDCDGAPVRLGTLWADQPAVLVWLRHFGCLFCKEQTAELRAHASEIEGRGAQLAFIGNGGTRYATGFRDEFCPGCTVLTDPDLRSYAAIGARHGLLTTVGPAAWGPALRAWRRGARQSAVQGHPFQQGGVVVVAPGDRVLFSHISRVAGDHPAAAAVISQIPGALAAR